MPRQEALGRQLHRKGDKRHSSSSVYMPGFKAKDITASLRYVGLGILHMVLKLLELNPVSLLLRRWRKANRSDTRSVTLTSRPRLWDLFTNVFLSYEGRKRKCLSWVHSVLPGRRDDVTDFGPSWQDGLALCSLMDALRPGYCAQVKLLKPHHRVNNCRLGLQLAVAYLDIAQAPLSPEEMSLAEEETEVKLVHLVQMVMWRFLKKGGKVEVECKVKGDEQLPCRCQARGTGIKAGIVGRRTKFNIFADIVVDLELQIEIKGPNNEHNKEIIISMPQTGSTAKYRSHILANSEDDGKAKLISDGAGHSFLRQKSLDEDLSHLIIPFDYQCVGEGRFLVTYIPRNVGLHYITILSKGRQIQGSPFEVKVSDWVSTWNCVPKTRVVPFDMFNTIQESPKEEAKAHSPAIHKLRRKLSHVAIMSMMKRRVLKKVITQGGEEIICDVTPSASTSSSAPSTPIVSNVDGNTDDEKKPLLMKKAEDEGIAGKENVEQDNRDDNDRNIPAHSFADTLRSPPHNPSTSPEAAISNSTLNSVGKWQLLMKTGTANNDNKSSKFDFKKLATVDNESSKDIRIKGQSSKTRFGASDDLVIPGNTFRLLGKDMSLKKWQETSRKIKSFDYSPCSPSPPSGLDSLIFQYEGQTLSKPLDGSIKKQGLNPEITSDVESGPIFKSSLREERKVYFADDESVQKNETTTSKDHGFTSVSNKTCSDDPLGESKVLRNKYEMSRRISKAADFDNVKDSENELKSSDQAKDEVQRDQIPIVVNKTKKEEECGQCGARLPSVCMCCVDSGNESYPPYGESDEDRGSSPAVCLECNACPPDKCQSPETLSQRHCRCSSLIDVAQTPTSLVEYPDGSSFKKSNDFLVTHTSSFNFLEDFGNDQDPREPILPQYNYSSLNSIEKDIPSSTNLPQYSSESLKNSVSTVNVFENRNVSTSTFYFRRLHPKRKSRSLDDLSEIDGKLVDPNRDNLPQRRARLASLKKAWHSFEFDSIPSNPSFEQEEVISKTKEQNAISRESANENGLKFPKETLDILQANMEVADINKEIGPDANHGMGRPEIAMNVRKFVNKEEELVARLSPYSFISDSIETRSLKSSPVNVSSLGYSSCSESLYGFNRLMTSNISPLSFCTNKSGNSDWSDQEETTNDRDNLLRTDPLGVDRSWSPQYNNYLISKSLNRPTCDSTLIPLVSSAEVRQYFPSSPEADTHSSKRRLSWTEESSNPTESSSMSGSLSGGEAYLKEPSNRRVGAAVIRDATYADAFEPITREKEAGCDESVYSEECEECKLCYEKQTRKFIPIVSKTGSQTDVSSDDYRSDEKHGEFGIKKYRSRLPFRINSNANDFKDIDETTRNDLQSIYFRSDLNLSTEPRVNDSNEACYSKEANIYSEVHSRITEGSDVNSMNEREATQGLCQYCCAPQERVTSPFERILTPTKFRNLDYPQSKMAADNPCCACLYKKCNDTHSNSDFLEFLDFVVTVCNKAQAVERRSADCSSNQPQNRNDSAVERTLTPTKYRSTTSNTTEGNLNETEMKRTAPTTTRNVFDDLQYHNNNNDEDGETESNINKYPRDSGLKPRGGDSTHGHFPECSEVEGRHQVSSCCTTTKYSQQHLQCQHNNDNENNNTSGCNININNLNIDIVQLYQEFLKLMTMTDDSESPSISRWCSCVCHNSANNNNNNNNNNINNNNNNNSNNSHNTVITNIHYGAYNVCNDFQGCVIKPDPSCSSYHNTQPISPRNPSFYSQSQSRDPKTERFQRRRKPVYNMIPNNQENPCFRCTFRSYGNESNLLKTSPSHNKTPQSDVFNHNENPNPNHYSDESDISVRTSYKALNASTYLTPQMEEQELSKQERREYHSSAAKLKYDRRYQEESKSTSKVKVNVETHNIDNNMTPPILSLNNPTDETGNAHRIRRHRDTDLKTRHQQTSHQERDSDCDSKKQNIESNARDNKGFIRDDQGEAHNIQIMLSREDQIVRSIPRPYHYQLDSLNKAKFDLNPFGENVAHGQSRSLLQGHKSIPSISPQQRQCLLQGLPQGDLEGLSWGANHNAESLSGANQKSVILSGANQNAESLSGANQNAESLSGANQKSVLLSGANQNAESLSGANQKSVILSGANQNAESLSGANQKSVLLSGANQNAESLSGANQNAESLSGANQKAVFLSGANQTAESLSGANQNLACSSGIDQNSTRRRSPRRPPLDPNFSCSLSTIDTLDSGIDNEYQC